MGKEVTMQSLLYLKISNTVTQYFLFAHCSLMFVFILTQNIILNHLLEYLVTSYQIYYKLVYTFEFSIQLAR